MLRCAKCQVPAFVQGRGLGLSVSDTLPICPPMRRLTQEMLSVRPCETGEHSNGSLRSSRKLRSLCAFSTLELIRLRYELVPQEKGA